MARRTTQRADKGVSLARFPALVLGSLLLAFGLLAFLKNGDNPTGGFPDGNVNGTNFLGFEVNGWTAFFTSVAGGLLLFGAAQHLLAKTMSLIVGLGLGACSVIALVDGNDVLGLAAANGWTMLGWGAASAFLLINTLLPRKGGRKANVDDRELATDRPAARTTEPVATERVETRTTDVRREDVGGGAGTRDDRYDAPGAATTSRDPRLDDAAGRPTDGSVADDTLRSERR